MSATTTFQIVQISKARQEEYYNIKTSQRTVNLIVLALSSKIKTE